MEIEKILEDPNSLAFMIYKGIEGAMDAAKGLDKSSPAYGKKMSKEVLDDAFKAVVDKYAGGSLQRKIMVNAAMSMPWPDALRIAYNVLLELGKNEDGSYGTTKDTILGSLRKYFGE